MISTFSSETLYLTKQTEKRCFKNWKKNKKKQLQKQTQYNDQDETKRISEEQS